MKKILVSGYYGFDNVGDDAMLEALASYFHEKNIDGVFLSKNPAKTEKQFNVKAIDRDNIFKIISEIKNSDIVFSGGGTLLQDITKVISIWYYLAIIILGILFKKPVYIVFQGIGPITNNFNIWLTKKILSKVTHIILREKSALNEMKKLGFDTSKVITATDLVFLLELPEENKNIDLIKKYVRDFNIYNKYIGISLRPWKNINNEVVFAKMCDKLAEECNAEIIFFPFHKAQDYKFTNDVIAKMNSKCHLIFDDFRPSQLGGIMSLMNVNIGVRLHSLVFSIIGKVPTIGITYDPKVDGFLNEVGLKATCNYSEIEVDNIVETAKKYINGEFSKDTFDKTIKNKEIIHEVLGDIIDGKYE